MTGDAGIAERGDAGVDAGAGSSVLPRSSVIAAGDSNFVAIAEDGSTATWSWTVRPTDAAFDAQRFVAVALGGTFDDELCGLTQEGAARCFFTTSTPPAAGDVPPDDVRFVRIAQWKARDVCGILQSGELACYGASALQPPSGRFTTLAGSNSLTFCALRVDGEAVCWPDYPSSPQVAPPPGPYVDIASSETVDCAIRQDGVAQCWDVFTGQLAELPGEWSQIHVVSPGIADVCGIRPDASVECFDVVWGAGTTHEVRAMRPPPAGRYVALAMSGFSEACAVRDDGAVVCWLPFTTGDPLPVPPEGLVARTR